MHTCWKTTRQSPYLAATVLNLLLHILIMTVPPPVCAQSSDLLRSASAAVTASTDLFGPPIDFSERYRVLDRAAGAFRLVLNNDAQSAAALNGLAVAILLGAKSINRERPLDLLRRAAQITDCPVVRKNLLWAEAADESTAKRSMYSSLIHETVTWHSQPDKPYST